MVLLVPGYLKPPLLLEAFPQEGGEEQGVTDRVQAPAGQQQGGHAGGEGGAPSAAQGAGRHVLDRAETRLANELRGMLEAAGEAPVKISILKVGGGGG